MNFDDNPAFANMPPLDRMRKIRRDIVKTINDLRETINVPGIVIDILSNKAANEYAEYLLGGGLDESTIAVRPDERHIVVVELLTRNTPARIIRIRQSKKCF